MFPRAVLLALALLSAPVLAGCVTPSSLTQQAANPLGGLLGQAAPLWPDHQNEPHPAYGWPTLTHPVNATGAMPAWWMPIEPAKVPSPIKGLQHVARSDAAVKSGAGIAVFGRLALVPGDSKENYVLDISDPTAPKLLGTYAGNERGAAMMAMPDGRLYGVVSTGPGFDVVNLTDPTHPEIVGNASPKTGGHKLGLVPGTPIVYNANSQGGGVGSNVPQNAKGQTEIYDLSNPEKPELVQEFKNGYGCHHIFFWISPEKQRAICAGIEMTQIWDIADPKAPKVIVNIPVHQGTPGTPSATTPFFPLMFSHTAFFNEKGDVLVVGDELNGGAFGVCDGVHTPVKDAAGPLGNLWFYDIKDEKNPKLLGWFSPPPAQVTDPRPPAVSNPTNVFGTVFGLPGCTAHHGRLIPDPDGKRQLLAMAWYGAGVVLVDFTNPANPRMIDEWNPGTNTWEVWYDNGYLFTGDLSRGLDVLTLK